MKSSTKRRGMNAVNRSAIDVHGYSETGLWSASDTEVGIGFELPLQTSSIVRNVPKSGFAAEVEVAVNYSEVS